MFTIIFDKENNQIHLRIYENLIEQFLVCNIQIEQAVTNGQDLRKKHEFRDQSWLGLKTRSRDPTLSRHKGININELYLHTKISQTPTGNLNKFV